MSEKKTGVFIFNEGNPVINKDNFNQKEVRIEENGEVISRINLTKKGIEVAGKNIFVNGEKVYNERLGD